MSPFIPNYTDATYPDQAEPDSGDFAVLLAGTRGNGVLSGCEVTSTVVPFAPTDISGLVAWYDFSDATTLFTDTGRTVPVTSDGDVIKGVTDKSGNGIHMSEATNGPTYKEVIQSGNSVARFDGTNDILSGGTITQFQPYTMIIAGKLTSTSGFRRFIDSPGHTVVYANFGTGFWAFYAGTAQDSTTAADNAWHVHAAKFDGASSTYRLDGTGLTIGNPGTGFTGASQIFFGRDDSSQFDALDYGEFCLYNSALSVPNQQSLEDYLQAKWGTP